MNALMNDVDLEKDTWRVRIFFDILVPVNFRIVKSLLWESDGGPVQVLVPAIAQPTVL